MENSTVNTILNDEIFKTKRTYGRVAGRPDIDWEKKEITAASYGYDEGGRYSVKKVYSIDGQFLRKVGDKERE